MSRTYRSITSGDYDFPREYRGEDHWWYRAERKSREELDLPKLNGVKLAFYNKRDRKPYYKPPRWFKKMKEQMFRARVKAALISGRPFPVYSHDNAWDWN